MSEWRMNWIPEVETGKVGCDATTTRRRWLTKDLKSYLVLDFQCQCDWSHRYCWFWTIGSESVVDGNVQGCPSIKSDQEVVCNGFPRFLFSIDDRYPDILCISYTIPAQFYLYALTMKMVQGFFCPQHPSITRTAHWHFNVRHSSFFSPLNLWWDL